MDRLDELAIFVAILDEGSLAAAGRKLRRSPPAVTRALATLEERVATRLGERTTRRGRAAGGGAAARRPPPPAARGLRRRGRRGRGGVGARRAAGHRAAGVRPAPRH